MKKYIYGVLKKLDNNRSVTKFPFGGWALEKFKKQTI